MLAFVLSITVDFGGDLATIMNRAADGWFKIKRKDVKRDSEQTDINPIL